MSIRWIRNVAVAGAKTTLEVQMGEHHIGDKCYTRVGKETEQWFDTKSGDRDTVLQQGLAILRKRLADQKVDHPDGRPFDWR